MSIDPLRPRDHAEAVALFRAEVVGGLARRELTRGELAAEFRALAQLRFRPPGAPATRCIAPSTLERWYYAYRRGGLAALRPAPRSDRGRARALTPEQRALVVEVRREHPLASAPLILRTLVADGRLAADAVSATTIARLLREAGLPRGARPDGHTRLRWQAEHPGALWHGDVCHGPALRIGQTTRPLRIHALLDDASRFVVALEAHHTEREADMLGIFLGALRRHGAPDALYLDNGSTYRGEGLRVACERLDITLLHARPGDAPARGKMERFWRTLRAGCLDHLGTLTHLHDVQARLLAFLDAHYHKAPHGGLLGKPPAEAWAGAKTQPIDETQLTAALTVRARRRVRRDGTLDIAGVPWQLAQSFLAGSLVTVAIDMTGAEVPYVEHDARRYALRPVDLVAASKTRRQRASTMPAGTVPFDPPGALLDRLAGRPPRHRPPEED
ncbi:MAG TPA: DDE-type integrase/transposase/recombinase [Kofleriaceae bacterium]|nr:DDE-type integrase/transposase/recombinase [Kofleriaceae bacterium]